MKVQYGEYVISDDKSLLDIEKICEFLARSYWANNRTKDAIEKSIDNSICYGVHDGSTQVGFARVITDWATVYYLCDVFIDETYRGKGLGKKLVEIITSDFAGIKGILATNDAHGLYGQFGFVKNAEHYMLRVPNF